MNSTFDLVCTATPTRRRAAEIRVAVIPGVDSNRPQKVNQDAYGSLCLGVMDGHGLEGHLVTEYVAERLPLILSEQQQQQSELIQPVNDLEEQLVRLGKADLSTLPTDPKELALIHAFHQVHHMAMQNESIPAGRSGTTCIACCLCQDKLLHVAYVGDSRAICIDDGDGGTVQTIAHPTTTREMAEERQRIEAGEGRIDDNGNVWYGPVAIAMTRALGDAVMLRAGVLPTPVTRTFMLPPKCTLVLATDGIWDVLSEEVVRGIVEKASSVQEAAQVLADTARKEWIGEFIDEKADDITCMVVRP